MVMMEMVTAAVMITFEIIKAINMLKMRLLTKENAVTAASVVEEAMVAVMEVMMTTVMIEMVMLVVMITL